MFCVMLSIVFFDKRIEAAILSSLGAMLFAFPALRSAVPGAPPIGAAIDYFAFFWAEMIVAVSLITLLVVYIRRPLPR
ncbi:MAG: hypothetical protein KatS3mg060_0794 [Dehalococcoidia bacterium]|nr:MAG: hypothetical protein KatS3mg060_0794 [Dehalococcoidia bacterium]